MNTSPEHCCAWIVRDVRDRCLEVIFRQMVMPAGTLSLRKLAAGGAVTDEETIAGLAMHITDLVIERFLFEVDHRIKTGDIQVDLRPDGSCLRVDSHVLVLQLYEQWVQEYSTVKVPSDMRKRFEGGVGEQS